MVVDIDETLLDNVPLNARDIINNQVYSYDRWNTWVEQAKAQALPGSVAFLQAARQKVSRCTTSPTASTARSRPPPKPAFARLSD